MCFFSQCRFYYCSTELLQVLEIKHYTIICADNAYRKASGLLPIHLSCEVTTATTGCADDTGAIKSLLPPIDHISTLEVSKTFSRFVELKGLVIIICYMWIVHD